MRNVVQIVFSDYLKAAGFTRKGSSWYRTDEDLITVVNLQGSQYGGKYYVNLALWLLALGEAVMPKEYQCHVRTRLDNFVGDDSDALERLLDFRTPLTDRDRGAALTGLLSEYLTPILEVTSSFDRLRSAEGVSFLDKTLVVGAAQPILGLSEDY